MWLYNLIFLVGKSTVGESFAKKLGYRFLDTDEIAEFMIEMPISEYFSRNKEAEFRQLEYQILMELAQYTRVVVATGGGIVMKPENWGLLRHGIVVWLDVAPDNIYDRLSSDPAQMKKRPLLQGNKPLQNLIDLHKSRLEKYELADLRIDVPATTVNYSPAAMADLVITELLSFIRNNPPQWQSWKAQRNQKAIDFASMVCMVIFSHQIYCILNASSIL